MPFTLKQARAEQEKAKDDTTWSYWSGYMAAMIDWDVDERKMRMEVEDNQAGPDMAVISQINKQKRYGINNLKT